MSRQRFDVLAFFFDAFRVLAFFGVTALVAFFATFFTRRAMPPIESVIRFASDFRAITAP
jgi:hypothetical protein